MKPSVESSTSDVWQFLQAYTPARIALGRAGHSLPTAELLKFQADHALARDAVYSTIDIQSFSEKLTKRLSHPVFSLKSKVNNRQEYLQRPDWGRRLSEESVAFLNKLNISESDICFVIADGLSADAVSNHALPVLENLIPQLQNLNWEIAPIIIVEQGRVAISDEIGFLLKAKIVVIFIGERPGLSSPDSMGAYLTLNPKVGLTDDSRNCISNIRPAGLSYEMASEKLLYLLTEIQNRQISGVNLKDEMDGSLGEREIGGMEGK
jgi:ethanolamine ammonia-lyase small subunit